MDDQVFLFAIFGIGGLLVATFGIYRLLRWRRYQEATTASTAEAEHVDGPVKVEGTVEPVTPGDVVESPLFGVDSVISEYRVERQYKNDDAPDDWRLEGNGKDSVPFLLRDSSGTAYVDPDTAKWSLEEESQYSDDLSNYINVDGFGLDLEVPLSHRRRLTEERLEPGTTAVVFGEAKTEPEESHRVRVSDGSNTPEFLVSDADIAETERRLLLTGGLLTLVGLVILGIGSYVMFLG
jgi:hypothetical protein